MKQVNVEKAVGIMKNNTFLFLFLLRALLFYDHIYPGAFIGSQSRIVAQGEEGA